MTALTPAERKARQRQREKGHGDLVREFLNGVIEDANRAVAADEPAEAWVIARSASAIEVLDALSEVTEERPQLLLNLIALSYGARTDEEKAAALRVHEREFAVWLRAHAPVKGKVATGPVIEHNERILAWANAERQEGRTTAAVLTQGIAAAKRIVRARQAGGTAEQFALFSAPARQKALSLVTSGRANL